MADQWYDGADRKLVSKILEKIAINKQTAHIYLSRLYGIHTLNLRKINLTK